MQTGANVVGWKGSSQQSGSRSKAKTKKDDDSETGEIGVGLRLMTPNKKAGTLGSGFGLCSIAIECYDDASASAFARASRSPRLRMSRSIGE